MTYQSYDQKTRTIDIHTRYEPRGRGLIQEVEVEVLRKFDQSGGFLGQESRETDRALYEATPTDPEAEILMVQGLGPVLVKKVVA